MISCFSIHKWYNFSCVLLCWGPGEVPDCGGIEFHLSRTKHICRWNLHYLGLQWRSVVLFISELFFCLIQCLKYLLTLKFSISLTCNLCMCEYFCIIKSHCFIHCSYLTKDQLFFNVFILELWLPFCFYFIIVYHFVIPCQCCYTVTWYYSRSVPYVVVQRFSWTLQ